MSEKGALLPTRQQLGEISVQLTGSEPSNIVLDMLELVYQFAAEEYGRGYHNGLKESGANAGAD